MAAVKYQSVEARAGGNPRLITVVVCGAQTLHSQQAVFKKTRLLSFLLAAKDAASRGEGTGARRGTPAAGDERAAVRTSGAGGREVSDERGKSLAGKKEGGSVAAGGWFVVFTVTFA